jgi:2-dehydropantoate 2-reductase
MNAVSRVVILGAGALGAYYASRFISAPGFTVAIAATGSRGAALRCDGLVVNARHFNVTVVEPLPGSTPADLVLVALKDYQLAGALPLLRPLVGAATIVLSVMNGLDSEAQIRAGCANGTILYCVAVGIDAVRQEGTVTVANAGRLVFGAADNHDPDPAVLRVQEALDRAGLEWQTPVDMLRMLWWKFMVNVGINQASAVLRAPYGVFQQSADARAVVTALMREVVALAQVAGINLDEGDLAAWDPVLNALSPAGKTSMLQDMEAGRRTEVEIFAGKVVALGEQYQVPTPANQMMLHLIRSMESG